MLRLEAVSVDYGRGAVLRDVTVPVDAGSIVSIIGANGAGKSTLMNVVSGLVEPCAGRVMFEGEDLHGVPAFRRVGRGIVQVPEGRELFPRMSVRENLLMGGASRRSRRQVEARVDEVLPLFPVLAERLGQTAGSLSGGEQQMLAIARGLVARPRIFLLDEPSLGLAPIVVAEIFRIVSRLRDGGVTVLIAEQNIRLSLAISDVAYVLENGAIVAEGVGRTMLEDERMKRSYFGLSMS